MEQLHDLCSSLNIMWVSGIEYLLDTDIDGTIKLIGT